MTDPIDDWVERRAARARREATTPVDRCGVYRNPRGGVEDVTAAVTAGMRSALLCLDFGTQEWEVVASRLDAAKVPWGLWFHCHTTEHVDWLLKLTMLTDRPFVGINVEAELGGKLGPSVLVERVRRSGYKGQPVLLTDGWVGNEIDLGPVADWPTMLEIMPHDNPNLWDPKVKTGQCLNHARSLGARRPLPLFGAQPISPSSCAKIASLGESPPQPGQAHGSWYPLDSFPSSGRYCVDDIGVRWSEWGWRVAADDTADRALRPRVGQAP